MKQRLSMIELEEVVAGCNDPDELQVILTKMQSGLEAVLPQLRKAVMTEPEGNFIFDFSGPRMKIGWKPTNK